MLCKFTFLQRSWKLVSLTVASNGLFFSLSFFLSLYGHSLLIRSFPERLLLHIHWNWNLRRWGLLCTSFLKHPFFLLLHDSSTFFLLFWSFCFLFVFISFSRLCMIKRMILWLSCGWEFFLEMVLLYFFLFDWICICVDTTWNVFGCRASFNFHI